MLDLQITSLDSSAVRPAAEIQARAFFDDPAFVFTFPDGATRRERLSWLMEIGVGYGCHYGKVSTTSGTMLGHAVWLPPGETSMAPERMATVGFEDAPARMGEDALVRFGNFMDLMSTHHERLVPVAHWYLMILGVDPEHQGRGVGSSLIAPTLARADADRLRCYLETAKERNVEFYRRHGFAVRHEEHIPGGGPKVWMMVREPRSL
jgi:ribosomal protein S18 acetylase RimI-like enzyme